ncbi:MAG: acyl-CoA dehydrogenase family protein [Desulfobacteraceae bacterium]|jgi:alkylation response protein AidB-like acyl-CoA dehydrogenase
MDFEFGQKEEVLRKEIREFVKEALPPGWLIYYILEEESRDQDWDFAMSMSRKLAQKGWLTMTWPEQYGGRGASEWEQLVYREEAGYWGIPGVTMGIGGVDWVGPSIMLHGTDEQKKTYLPLIASGGPDGVWCTAYSEPDAGSDFANIRTEAIRDKDGYVINGQKVWTSAAHRSRWMWLAAVTDPKATTKHQGISIFIVDMKSKGLTVNPLINYTGYHVFNEIFFDNVKIPAENLVGEENRGWYQLMDALAFERGSLGPSSCGFNMRLLDELILYAKESGLFQSQVIRHKLADRAIEVEMAKMLTYERICKMNKGKTPVYEAARDKVLSDMVTERLATTGTEILGAYAQIDPVHRESKWTRISGAMTSCFWLFPGLSIAAGTAEIEKNIIGQFGLRLPKSF